MSNIQEYSTKLFLILIIFLSLIKIYAQDSLFLVGTITGESTDKRITDVKGIGDVNGDGYDDFMAASYVSNTVTLYLGSSGLNLIKDVTFKPHSSMKQVVNFGWISGIGDVNADGYDDFIIHAAFRDYVLGKGIVFLYYGGMEVDTVPVNEFYEDWNQDGFGSFTTGIG
ncbi:MAG: VCBS repeat-containing protein, partial [Ignavibacteriaceae bacterium]